MAKTGRKHIDESDASLIGRALQGEQSAFTELLVRYRNALIQHIQKKFPTVREDAEDICQRSFEKAFMGIDKFNPQFAFSTWLYKIAENEAKDQLRKSKSSINSVSLSADGEAFTVLVDATPEEQVIIDQGVGELVRRIGNLPDMYKDVAEYRFIKDYSYEDIAEALGIPLGTVKTRLNRARRILAEKYDRQTNGDDS